MDVHDKLDELTQLVRSARAMPMSTSCVLNRTELLGLVADIRELLPEELGHADLLLRDREALVEEARREARQIVDEARAEQERLVAETEVLRAAHAEADEVRAAAQEEAAAIRHEVDDYVDTKLANFEIVLTRTLGAVERGRDKLRGRTAFGEADASGPAAGAMQAAGAMEAAG